MPHPSWRLLSTPLIILASLLMIPARPAQAHPHVWIDAFVEAQMQGTQLTALHLVWSMDELYSQATASGYDTNGDGTVTAQELQPLIEKAMESLEEWYYFVDLRQDGQRLAFATPTQAQARMEGDRLVYDFTLPLAQSVALTAPIRARIFDPSLYIGIDLLKTEPVTLTGAGATCRRAIIPPKGLPETMLMSEQAFTSDAEPGTEGLGGRFAETVEISCGS